MYTFYKSKRVDKFGGFLQGKMKKSFLWKGIEASQVGEIFKETSLELKELRGSQFVSWRDNVIKIKVSSSAQRQAIILKKPLILEELKKRGLAVKEIKIAFR
jgi:hypothetical protein